MFIACSPQLNIEIATDRYLNIDKKAYYLEILEPDEKSGEKEYLIGKISVIPNCSFWGDQEEQVINCYVCTADEFEMYKSGQAPGECLFKIEQNSSITLPLVILDWSKEKKYYLIISNRFSSSPKIVHLFLIKIKGDL